MAIVGELMMEAIVELLTYLVQGSEADPYRIQFLRNGERLTITCSCAAGELGQVCKHRMNLIVGDVTALVGGDDPARVAGLIEGSNVERALGAVAEAQRTLDDAKRFLSRQKKVLGHVMAGH